MLANLANPPLDPHGLSRWTFSNDSNHRDIIQSIAKLNNTTILLPIYQLYPVALYDVKNWLQRHQQMHNDMNAVLNLGGSDLSDLNFQDKEQLIGWVELHFSEHYAACNALGIS